MSGEIHEQFIQSESTLREEIFAVEDSKGSEIRGIYFRVACP